MSVDWFTVLAQIINFLVLVWLLKRFLYHPILKAIDARELRIAETLADAADKQNRAQQERDLFTEKNRALEEQRSTLIKAATTAAAAERQRLLEEAKSAADVLSLQCQESLQHQQQNLSAELSRKTQQEIFAISRQTLRDLADIDLEEQIIKVFLSQLQELDSHSKATLSGAIATSSKALRVRSSFTLQAAQQKRISSTINKSFATDRPLNFETSSEIISGIELTVNGQKLAWSISQYIDSLEKHLQQLLQQPLAQDFTKKSDRDNE
jgi:F-type H+-transporting ATPase subunit b